MKQVFTKGILLSITLLSTLGGVALAGAGGTMVSGVCGSSNGTNTTSIPATNLCNTGTPSIVTPKANNMRSWSWNCENYNPTFANSSNLNGLCENGNRLYITSNNPWTWLWSCVGRGGGSTAYCSASSPMIVENGVCGVANGVPTNPDGRNGVLDTDKCNRGVPTSTILSGNNFTWSCNGINGGSTISCQAPSILQMNYGKCGSANNPSGTPLSAAPASNLCVIGRSGKPHETFDPGQNREIRERVCGGYYTDNNGTQYVSNIAGPVNPDDYCSVPSSNQYPPMDMSVRGQCAMSGDTTIGTMIGKKQCDAGNPANLIKDANNNRTWDCLGYDTNGVTISDIGSGDIGCNAQEIDIVPACGSDDGNTLPTGPVNLCDSGTPTHNLFGNGLSRYWSCVGSDGVESYCSANVASKPESCGMTNIIGTRDIKQVYSIAAQPNGEAFLGANGHRRLLKLTSNGSLDQSVTKWKQQHWGAIYSTVILSGGKILVGGMLGKDSIHTSLYYGESDTNTFSGKNTFYTGFARLYNNGSIDTSFNQGGLGFNDKDSNNRYVTSIAVQSNGDIIVGGDFSSYNGISVSNILRLHADGSLDTSFNQGGIGFKHSDLEIGYVTSIAVQSNGDIIVGGKFSSYNGISVSDILRLHADGSLDTSFNQGAGFTTKGDVLGEGNKGSMWGKWGSNNGLQVAGPHGLDIFPSLPFASAISPYVEWSSEYWPYRYKLGGSHTIVGDVNTILLQSDGKILVGGSITSYDGTDLYGLVRLNTDGSLDTGFNQGGEGFTNNVGLPGDIYAMTLQLDGKIFVGGHFNYYNGIDSNGYGLVRLNTDGSLDTGFNQGGKGFTMKMKSPGAVYSVALTPNGKLFVGGHFNYYNEFKAEGMVAININNGCDGSCGSSSGNVFTDAPTDNLCEIGNASDVTGTGPWNRSCSRPSGSGLYGGATATCSAFAPVDGSCGTANNSVATATPTTGLCTAGTPTAVIGTGPWNRSCSGINGGYDSSTCTANTQGFACGPSNGATLASIPTEGLCSTTTQYTITPTAVAGTGPWTWSCLVQETDTHYPCQANHTPIAGVCGAANGTNRTSTPPNDQLCSAGTSSALVGTGPWIWHCYGLFGGSSSVCTARVPIAGVCGTANGSTLTSIPTTGLCSAGKATTVGGTGPWTRSCTGLFSGATSNTCTANTPVAGACGSSNDAILNSAPTTGFCSTGTPSAVVGTGPWTWSCSGLFGGDTSSTCTANKPVIGTCGATNGAILNTIPTTGLCNTGTPTAVTGINGTINGPWRWNCMGSFGGAASALCIAKTPIAGVCGATNGTVRTSVPISGFCSTGTPTSVTGTGPWNWSCIGLFSGATVNCSADKPIDGVCGPSHNASFTSIPTTGLCTTGNATTVNGSGPWNWSCTGLFSGATVNCSASLDSAGGTQVCTTTVEPMLVCDVSKTLIAGVCYTPGAVTPGTAYNTAGLTVRGGKVGVNNTNPIYPLDVFGSVHDTAQLTTSDARLKSSIEKIDNALADISKINGYQFTRKQTGKPDYGVLAQEVEKIYANAVLTDLNGYKAVQYSALLAPIINAIHELNTNIDEQISIAQSQAARIKTLEKKTK